METTTLRVAAAADAASALLGIGIDTRNAALENIADSLDRQRGDIEAANRKDLDAARAGQLAAPLLKRLSFQGHKIDEAIAGVRALVTLPDPLGRVLEARLLDEGLVLRRVTCPIGLVATIFESRPDALVQMACLAAKSGNAIVLKGGSEARETNRTLSALIAAAGEAAGLPSGWLAALETRDETAELLKLDQYVDLVVPRGSKEFVAAIKATSRIPVLGHSDGVCHVYIHEDADPEMARAIAVDAKTQYPAVCNAAEVLLIDRSWAALHGAALLEALARAGVTLDLCPESLALSKSAGLLEGDLAGRFVPKTDEAWSVEYLDLRMAVKITGSLDEAIAHINRYGSGHTDAIVTAPSGDAKGDAAAARFMNRVDSASVYRNASTRFADGYRYGLGAEVGIATGKLHARGPMGLDGLVTYKWLLEGSGNIVADYASGTRGFLHRDLPLDRPN
jgi:glutamate-5-semialdehyde dehydrogenase